MAPNNESSVDEIKALEMWSREATNLVSEVRRLTGEPLEALPPELLATVDVRDKAKFSRDLPGYFKWRRGADALLRQLEQRQRPAPRTRSPGAAPSTGREKIARVVEAGRKLGAGEISREEYLRTLDANRGSR
jgi:hypothetical protein